MQLQMLPPHKTLTCAQKDVPRLDVFDSLIGRSPDLRLVGHRGFYRRAVRISNPDTH